MTRNSFQRVFYVFTEPILSPLCEHKLGGTLSTRMSRVTSQGFLTPGALTLRHLKPLCRVKEVAGEDRSHSKDSQTRNRQQACFKH